MTPPPDEIRSIYSGIAQRPGLSLDLSGWNSTTPIFNEVIGLTLPKIIVEAGVWNGASVCHMAELCKARGLSTTIYAIDVFPGRIGLHDHMGHLPTSQIPTDWRAPSRYEQFLFNVKASGHDDCVIPVHNFTRWGAKMLAHWGVIADLVYVDAGHDDEFVYADLCDYWPLIRIGGKMFGDDIGYPGVLAALGRFGKERNLSLGMVGHQWYYNKA